MTTLDMTGAEAGNVVVVADNGNDLEVSDEAPGGGGASAFADLTDVDLTAAEAGSVLVMNDTVDGVETAVSVIPAGVPDSGTVLTSDEGTPTWMPGIIAVEHGSNASTPRPTGAVAVYWKGSVTPSNAENGDWFYDTTGD